MSLFEDTKNSDKYVTALMDISAGTVAAGSKLTGRIDPGMKTIRNSDRIYEKQICSYFH